MADFVAPSFNPFVIGSARLLLPVYLRYCQLEIRATAQCRKAIAESRRNTVLMVNHSDRFDPVVVFALSKLCDRNLHYLAARELFDGNFGLDGWLLQGCGAYSVIRGQGDDMASKEATISLVADGTSTLVMFPEGDVTGRDDEILPLRKDGLDNLLQAQFQASQAHEDAEVSLLPVAIYFQVTDAGSRRMQMSIAELEHALGLGQNQESLIRRVGRIVERFVQRLENLYQFRPANRAVDERLTDLCHQMTRMVAHELSIQVDKSMSTDFYLYTVRSEVRGVKQSGQRDVRAAVYMLDRAEQLLILASTLRQRPITTESAWKIIDRLQPMILNRTESVQNRIAWVDAGDPIGLQELQLWYQRDPAAAIERADQMMRAAMDRVLAGIKQEHEPKLLSVSERS